GCAATPTRDAIILPAGARIVDLSHSFDETTVYWPTETVGFRHEPILVGQTERGFFYAAYSICAPEHGGTHLDAPIHFAEHGVTVDAIPLERLVAPAVVIDFTAAASADRDALLGRADIEAFEAEHGPISPGTIVLVRTGWEQRWPDRERYLGDATPGDASNLHFPGLGEDAARL